MARTVTQISQTIKANFVANATLAEAYSLDQSKTFDEQFSSVSIEGMIIYVISLAHYIIESLMDTFSKEIDQRIANAYLASIPWYYAKVLEFQLGYALVFNSTSYSFGYESVNEDARVIKYAAIRQEEDTITKLKIYVANSSKEPITAEQMTAFEAYIKRVGAAGIHYEFVNQNADLLRIAVQIIFDPLVINSTGQRMIDGSYPVRLAISAYIDSLSFGGTTFRGIFNRTKLIDSIQAVEGVNDVILIAIERSEYEGEFAAVDGQNIESIAGSFKIDTLTDTYTPDV